MGTLFFPGKLKRYDFTSRINTSFLEAEDKMLLVSTSKSGVLSSPNEIAKVFAWTQGKPRTIHSDTSSIPYLINHNGALITHGYSKFAEGNLKSGLVDVFTNRLLVPGYFDKVVSHDGKLYSAYLEIKEPEKSSKYYETKLAVIKEDGSLVEENSILGRVFNIASTPQGIVASAKLHEYDPEINGLVNLTNGMIMASYPSTKVQGIFDFPEWFHAIASFEGAYLYARTAGSWGIYNSGNKRIASFGALDKIILEEVKLQNIFCNMGREESVVENGFSKLVMLEDLAKKYLGYSETYAKIEMKKSLEVKTLSEQDFNSIFYATDRRSALKHFVYENFFITNLTVFNGHLVFCAGKNLYAMNLVQEENNMMPFYNNIWKFRDPITSLVIVDGEVKKIKGKANLRMGSRKKGSNSIRRVA